MSHELVPSTPITRDVIDGSVGLRQLGQHGQAMGFQFGIHDAGSAVP
jgi:hypothetical protein